MFQQVKSGKNRPCVIVASSDDGFSQKILETFTIDGWYTLLAKSASAVRRLARLTAPAVVLMSTNLSDESGWLTCDKLTREMPWAKVFLIGKDDKQSREFAAFVGAVELLSDTLSYRVIAERIAGASPVLVA